MNLTIEQWEELENNPLWKFFIDVETESSLLGSTLKGHLLIEELMTELLSKTFIKRSRLKEAKLSFHQKLKLVLALDSGLVSDDLGAILTTLNKIRNDFAHEIEPLKLDDNLTRFIKQLPKVIVINNKVIEINRNVELNASDGMNAEFLAKKRMETAYIQGMKWCVSELFNITNDYGVNR